MLIPSVRRQQCSAWAAALGGCHVHAVHAGVYWQAAWQVPHEAIAPMSTTLLPLGHWPKTKLKSAATGSHPVPLTLLGVRAASLVKG